MDKIVLKSMKFYGYHGVRQDEQLNGQQFIIDVEMKADLKAAGESDSLEDTVDYSRVFNTVKHITENFRFSLVEKLAESICSEILSVFNKIAEVDVTVKKPDAPIEGEFDWVGVRITRRRNV